MSATPGGRSTRLEYVWFVMRFVIECVECSSRMFRTSGSENGASPRKSAADQFMLAPLPPHRPP